MTNILYVCEMPAYHVANELVLLRENGFNVIVLNVFKSSFQNVENYNEDVVLYNLHESLKQYPSIKMIKFIYKQYIDFHFIDEIIMKHNIEIIYSSWSSVVVVDAFLIKERHPSLKWIHRYLMYPASINKYKVYFENLVIKIYTKYIDVIIFHTEEMKNYFTKKVNGNFRDYQVSFEKFNKTYFLDCNSYKEPSLDKFSLIFLGTIIPNTENDVIKELEDIPQEIDVYVSIKDEYKKLIRNNNIKFFERKKIGSELTNYIQKFDGILTLYNSNNLESERINLVIPNRVTLGIPALKRFFIPSGQLYASKKLLKKYDLLCEYDNNNQLLKLLKLNREDKVLEKEKIINKLVLGNDFIKLFRKDLEND